MRKHNEGYALVLVLVVLLVLALLSSIILTGAQRNIQAQSSSIEYMVAKYKAQGEIQKIIAKLEALPDDALQTVTLVEEGNSDLEVEVDCENKTITIVSRYDQVQIDCKLLVKCEELEVAAVEGVYSVFAFAGVTYLKYEISTIGGNGA